MYENLAYFYDMYTGDLDRDELADFLEKRFEAFGNEGLKALALRSNGSKKAKCPKKKLSASETRTDGVENDPVMPRTSQLTGCEEIITKHYHDDMLVLGADAQG